VAAAVAAVAVVDVAVAEDAGVVDAAAVDAAGDGRRTTMRAYVRTFVSIVVLVTLASAHAADTPEQPKFARPEDAMRALVTAVRAGDHAKVVEILGPGSDDLLSSGDPVDDKATADRFAARATERTRFETLESGAVIAHIGKDDWPFAIPLAKDGEKWRFDTAAGKEEVLNRRIGTNELKAVDVAHVYVEAQREYASKPRNGDGKRAYAQKVRSEPGKKDGLYWDDPTGKQPSPLGPLMAEADAEGYTRAEGDTSPRPYHGYIFRVLTAQGPKAPGGARNYIVDGRMTGGFALLAYPAEYGESGIMTFLVGPAGIVYQKNLGEKTAETAAAMKTYDPDDSWAPIRD
jgi:hypothetical protein